MAVLRFGSVWGFECVGIVGQTEWEVSFVILCTFISRRTSDFCVCRLCNCVCVIPDGNSHVGICIVLVYAM